MSRFNTVDKRAPRERATSPITTEATASGVTHEGGPGFARNAKSELFLLAVSNMVGEDTFYEKAGDRDGRYAELVRQVAVADPVWMLGFLGWLRSEGNMRSASLVGAAEAVHARLAVNRTIEAGGHVTVVESGNRQMVAAVLQRADEPGEFLAYWRQTFGRNLPKPVKRGIADAVRRLYNEYALLKYDTASHRFRFGDVIDLVHPSPSAPWQGDLFRYALDRRHGRNNEVPGLLSMVRRQAEWRANADASPLPVEGLLDPEHIRGAGLTWEDVLSLLGSKVDKAQLWSALIPSMGYMALLRNLRNFDEAGVPDEIAAEVAARLADPEQVAKSRQLPMRFLSAFRSVPSLRWGQALEVALGHSLANVPPLPGRTLVLVDVSGSMDNRMSGKSGLSRVDAAKVFGAAVALRAEQPTLVWFNNASGQVPVPKGMALLRLVQVLPSAMGGTATAAAVQRWFDRHDRVVIVTDEQAGNHFGGWGSGPVDAAVPASTPIYTWNLAGYERGHLPSGSGARHTFGGLSDAAFRMIPLLEAGRNAAWPWQAVAS